ncbi:MAG TPA: hypothetical protein VIT85_06325 [Solirubrobacterales bacterium]
MADLGEKLEPVASGLLEPGEALRGCCLATRQSAFRGWMVAIAVTDRRLALQRLTRKFEPDGEPLSLPPERIASAKAEGGAGDWMQLETMLVDELAVTLKIETTDGEKLKLRMMRAEGPFQGLGGGQAQADGVRVLGEWFADLEAEQLG